MFKIPSPGQKSIFSSKASFFEQQERCFYGSKKPCLTEKPIFFASVFSEQGEPLFSLKEESFTIDPAQISIINGSVTTASIFGETMGIGYNYGWRWLRSRMRIFDLSPLLTSNADSPLEIDQKAILCQPNPAVGRLQIDFKNFFGKSIHVSLVSSSGIQVLEKEYDILEKENMSIDVGNLPNGQYFLSLCQSGKTLTQKIVILKHD